MQQCSILISLFQCNQITEAYLRRIGTISMARLVSNKHSFPLSEFVCSEKLSPSSEFLPSVGFIVMQQISWKMQFSPLRNKTMKAVFDAFHLRQTR